MTTKTFSTTDALYAGVKAAAAGDVLVLAPGKYPALNLSNLKVPSPGVVRVDGAKAVTIGEITMTGAEGIELSNLKALQPKDADPAKPGWRGAVMIDGKRLRLTNIDASSLAGRSGIQVRNTSDVILSGCYVHGAGVGIAVQDVDKISILGGEVTAVTVDGIDMGGVSNSVIDGVYLHDFTMTAPGTHPDAIQYWETALTPKAKCVNNIARRNIIARGAGTIMQGIFVESQTNLTITDNAMIGTMYNGIGVSTTDTALIENNFVQGYPDMDTRIITRGGSSNVTVRGNTTQAVFQYIDKDKAGAAIPNPNYVEVNNVIIAAAPQGSRADLDAWLAKQNGAPAPTPAPPAPPPPPPVVDPTIELKGEIQALQTQLDTANKQKADLQAQLDAANAKVAAQATVLSNALAAADKLRAALSA